MPEDLMSHPTHPSDSAASRESAAAKEELIARIVGVLSRTFSGENQVRAVESLSAQFLAMDEAALRQLALGMGLDEPGEPEPDES
jgi:hypothetical protein